MKNPEDPHREHDASITKVGKALADHLDSEDVRSLRRLGIQTSIVVVDDSRYPADMLYAAVETAENLLLAEERIGVIRDLNRCRNRKDVEDLLGRSEPFRASSFPSLVLRPESSRVGVVLAESFAHVPVVRLEGA